MINDTYNEYIKRTRLATDFNQRYLRNRIRNHIKFIKGIENFPIRSKCVTSLSALSDDELVAYDEYLNCIINGYMFQGFLTQSGRFTESD